MSESKFVWLVMSGAGDARRVEDIFESEADANMNAFDMESDGKQTYKVEKWLVQSSQSIMSCGCMPGVWYECEKYGRVLCCGTSNENEWVMSFAVRTEAGQTQMRYIHDQQMIRCSIQSWG